MFVDPASVMFVVLICILVCEILKINNSAFKIWLIANCSSTKTYTPSLTGKRLISRLFSFSFSQSSGCGIGIGLVYGLSACTSYIQLWGGWPFNFIALGKLVGSSPCVCVCVCVCVCTVCVCVCVCVCTFCNFANCAWQNLSAG